MFYVNDFIYLKYVNHTYHSETILEWHTKYKTKTIPALKLSVCFSLILFSLFILITYSTYTVLFEKCTQPRIKNMCTYLS